jgi:hypothetical protein
MLHILLLILKILGIMLISTLGITILIICLVLFVPAVYYVDVFNKDVRLEAKWLFRMMSTYFVYKDGKSDWNFRIAWFRWPNEKKKNSQKESEQTKKKQNWFDKLKCTTKKFCDKIKEIWRNLKKISKFIKNEKNKRAFQKIQNEAIYLLKKSYPKKIEGYVKFGMEDPYNTGRILAGISLIYPLVAEHVSIEPDFENKVFEGKLYAKGYVLGITLLCVFLRTFFDKDIRTLYKRLNKKKMVLNI